MMLKLGVGILLLSLTIVCVQNIVHIIHKMGFHKTVYNHSPGPCRLIPGVDFGSEDLETLSDGRTFITSGMYIDTAPPEFKQYYKDNNVEGSVFFFDFKEPDMGVTKLTYSDGFDKTTFFPHGISLIQNEKTGTITLIVVNHHPEGDKIEQFEFCQDKMMLQHKKSYTNAVMRMVNDVAAVSEDSFYFTNSVYSKNRLGVMAEVLLSLKYANVVFFDGKDYKVMADNIAVLPNGILLSKDLKNLYVANSDTTSVQIYDRSKNNELSLVEDYPVYSGADNLLIEPKSGNIVIGAHPVSHLAYQHIANPRLAAPSQVLRLHMANGSHVERMTELYSDDGTFFSGSSVASIYDDYMLVGSVLSKLMYCEIRYLPE